VDSDPNRVIWTDEELEVPAWLRRTPSGAGISRTKTYTYWAPFNYKNVKVDLGSRGRGGVQPGWRGTGHYPYGAITIEEEEPIVAVTVIGSGCSCPRTLSWRPNRWCGSTEDLGEDGQA